MRKYIIIFLAITSFYLCSCKEDDKIRFPETTTGIIPTIDIVPGKAVFDSTNKAEAEIAFELDYNNFGGNLRAESIVVKVARLASFSASEVSPNAAAARVYTTVTAFPSTVTIRLAEVANLLGIADINTFLSNNAIDVIFEVRASNGVTYSAASNNNAGVNTAYALGNFRRRFFIGCSSNILPGTYTATASVSVGAGPASTHQNTVRINRQVITLDFATWINVLPDIYTITDLSGGFYENNANFPNTALNQPIGIRDVCGTFSLFNNALFTLPSPFPQRDFTITSGSWNASSNTLILSWEDNDPGEVSSVQGTTTFVRTGD